MANTVKDAVQNIVDRTAEATTSEPAQNLQLDEVTGEKVSKTERTIAFQTIYENRRRPMDGLAN